MPQAVLEAQLAPYSPLPDELVRLEIESLAGDLEKEFNPKSPRRAKSVKKPVTKKSIAKKTTTTKPAKRVVKKAGTSTKRAAPKASR